MKEFWNKFRKGTSMALIFAILFVQTIQIPFLEKVSASRAEYPNLVSILIPASMNSGDLSDGVEQYAKNIQWALPLSRAIIVEVPDDATPEKIAAINEKLYYEGDGKDSARLVGTILVGKLPLPVVHKKEKTFLSVFPYVDFKDKAFVYDTSKGYYEASNDTSAGDTPEIWHGIIAPNTGNTSEDTQKLIAFFAKTHEFYTGSGKYSTENTRPEPYVFYFDTYHDELSIKSEDWQAYKLGLSNIEDIIYNRYNKHFAKTLYDTYQGILMSAQGAITDGDLKKALAEAGTSSIDLTSAPDVQTEAVITKIAKQFTDVLNSKYLGEILRYVYNAGRYGNGQNVHVDISAALIAKQDTYTVKTMKDITSSVEKAIDLLVKNGFSRDIAISTDYSVNTVTSSGSGSSAGEGGSSTAKKESSSNKSYSNYFMGRKADTLTQAKDCTIVRGSTLRAEMNRGLNPNNAEGDVTLLNGDLGASCFGGGTPATKSYWGGNSPLNANFETIPYALKSHVYSGFSKSIFDNGGGYELAADSTLGQLSPEKCLAIDLLANPYTSTDAEWISTSFPSETGGSRFSCITAHQSAKIKTFAGYYNDGFEGEACTSYHLNLDGKVAASSEAICDDMGNGSGTSGGTSNTNRNSNTSSTATTGGGGSVTNITKDYSYKKISSVIEHKSPTLEEYGEQMKAMTTFSLPSDRDRFVSFISPKGTEISIQYPNFFRIVLDENSLTQEKAKAKIKELLDKKSAEINALISAENPAALSGKSADLYALLKTGNYPNADVDLYALLATKEAALDSIANAVVWNNLASPTTKYAYLLENFLDTDGNSPIPLSGHRSDYEIAYIGGKGDAQNLFLKVDPEAKLPLPEEIATLSSDMASFASSLSAMNAAKNTNSASGSFKCSPPDGVPLWEWLPAVFCWIATIIPPTIGAGSCSSSSMTDFLQKEKEWQLTDANKNGTADAYEDANTNGIADGMELIKDGRIGLSSTNKRVSHSSSITLTATLYDKKDSRILVDSGNDVSFEVQKIVDRTSKIPKTVYVEGESGDLWDSTVIRKYVNIGSDRNAEAPAKVRVKDGVAEFTFSSNTLDADITFSATVSPRDKNGKAAFVKISDPYALEIRDESLSITFSRENGEVINGDIRAGDEASLKIDITKMRSGEVAELSYPITLRIYDDTTDAIVGDPIVINTTSYVLKGSLLNRSGSYRFEFSEKNGLLEKSSFNILSAAAVKLDVVPASNMFVRGEKDKIVVRVVDKFGNLVQGDLVNLTGKLSGGGYFDENKSDTLTRSIVDGYTSFDVSSNNGGENINLSISTSNGSLKQDTSLKTIEYAKVVSEVSDAENIVAGKDPHTVKFKLVDTAGNTLSDFQWYASLDFPAASGYFDTNLVKIENGISSSGALLYPKTIAGNNLAIAISIPGVKDISGNLVDVQNDIPMYVTLAAELAQLEANPANSEKITAALHDRYGNIASYKTEGFTAAIKVAAGFERFAHLTENSVVAFSKGIAETRLAATSLPGTSYLSVEITPSIEANTASYTGEDGKTVTLSGKNRNILKVETFYLWNKSKLDKTDYNALYSVLLGAEYGDVTQENYLAGEMLFRPNSRSLAVTSLLSKGLVYDRVVSITPAGKIELSADSFTEVSLGEEQGRTAITVTDSYSNVGIAKAYMSLGSGTDFLACENDGNDGIDNCQVPTTSNSYVILKPKDDLSVLSGNGLSLAANGAGKLVEITPSGLIRSNGNVKFELDVENTKNLLALKISYGGKEVGYLAIKMRSEDITLAGVSENIAEILAARPYSFIVQSISPNYITQNNFLGNSSFGKKWVSFVLASEASGTSADRDLVGNSNKMGYESYYEEAGIGWEGANKTLLDFAGGSSVGEANKFYASYNTVNLGDPVVRLARKSDATYDRTIGSRIMQSSDDAIESYKSFDYNHDGLLDIIVFLSSGKMRLFENEGGTFRDMGNLAYVADVGDSRKSVGNFEGDGFDDIVFVDKKGALLLLQNHDGKFSRVSAPVENADGSAATIAGKITQLAVYDMDQDGLDDIVIGDDSGVIATLYAGKRNNTLVFTRKVVDSSLGLRISGKTTTSGSAIRYDGIGEVAEHSQSDYATESANMDPNATGLPADVAKTLADSRIYYISTVTTVQEIPATGTTLANNLANGTIGNDPENPNSANSAVADSIKTTYETLENKAGSGSLPDNLSVQKEEKLTFIRSEFSQAKGVSVEKTFTDKNGAPLQGNDTIQTNITVRNNSGKALKNVRLLDSTDAKVSRMEDTSYSLKVANGSEVKGTATQLEGESYDYSFSPFNLGAGQSATISYATKANTLSFGRFVVGALNSGDSYGDIAMAKNNTCTDSMTLWAGSNQSERLFTKTDQSFTGAELPKEITSLQTDANANNIPDSLEGILGGSSNAAEIESYASGALSTYNQDSNQNSVPDRGEDAGTLNSGVDINSANLEIDVGGLGENADAINSQIDQMVAGFGCGFGGGSCVSLPLNWAPLAPGSSPSAFGYPMSDLSVTTGVPVFAFPAKCPPYLFVWPACPIGAGGYLGPSNVSQFRLFVTPTITGAIGAAVCFGANYSVGDRGNPKGASPVVPGGNCVVAAKPLALCKDDGSDGNVNSLWYQSGNYSANGAFINSNSCIATLNSNTYTSSELSTLTQYASTGNNAVQAGTIAGGKSLSSLGQGPLVGIGTANGEDPNFEVSVDTKALKNFDLGNIVNIKNTRIAAFPDFLMDWANRQLEEIVNKLTSLPTLMIILPDFSKIFESGWVNFGKNLSDSYSNGTKSYQDKDYSVGKSETTGFKEAKSSTNAFLSQNKSTINSGERSISGVKAAYKFLSKLPAISFENQIVNMSIPIISEEDVKKSLSALKQWQTEYNQKKAMWAKLGTKEGLNEKASLDASRLSSSINENIKILQGYGEFPSKLQKYLTWKQRYASQIICNVEMIEKVMGGWIYDNGKRFKTWVEFYMLIKAILKSWQPLVDVFVDYKAECGTCKNERFDLKQFMFKIISAVVPKIPIIQFPKWPDIIVDLHNVRLGLRIIMPEFAYSFTPIIIPHIPELHLPDTPSAGLSLPGLPRLPKIPELPNLPDLPSLPEIKLPDLPPPPKIPKLFSSITAILKIFKIVAKVLCIMRTNPFVPEWRAGDQIAQITSRSGTFSLDFLNMEFPNFPISFLKAIKVTTFVNLEFQADFILEMAKATVEPINQFTSNITNLGAGLQPQNINIQGPGDIKVDVPGQEGQEIANPLKKNSFMPSSQTKTAMVGWFALQLANGMKEVLAAMKEQSENELTLGEFKSAILSETHELRKEKNPKILAIADSLERAASYDGSAEDSLIASLLADNTAKFSITKNAIRDEIRATEVLQAKFREFYSSKNPAGLDFQTNNTIKIASIPSGNSTDSANALLANYNDSAANALLALRDSGSENELKDIGQTLQDRVLALTNEAKTETFSEKSEREKAEFATSTTAGSVTTSENALSQAKSSYTYRGIYYFENGTQKRLFDYTEELDGTEEIAFANRTSGGKNNSIVYRMDNGLYIKHPVADTPHGANTDSPDTFDFEDILGNNITPTAPNYFDESVVSPDEIQFSFAPANKDENKKFRLEFYDYIERFDLLKNGNNPNTLPVKVPLQTIDLFVNDSRLVVDSTKVWAIISKTEATYDRGSGDVSGNIPEYKIFESGNSMKISAGKRLYAYDGSARIKYRKDESTQWEMASLAEYENIEFSEAMEVEILGGSTIFAEDRYSDKTIDVNTLVGFPVMEKTTLSLLGESGFLSIRYDDGSSLRVDHKGSYSLMNLGSVSDSYAVSVQRPNDFYYAKLLAFGDNKDTTEASLTLLSPQTAADTSGPISTGLSDTYRIPIYTKELFQAKTYFSDISGVAKLFADTDSSVDSDGDDIADNDPDSDTGSFVKKGGDSTELMIGPFDAPGNHQVTLNVVDGNGNVTKQNLTIVAYAPIPEISSDSGSSLSGKLEKEITGEPIDIMRVRAGKIQRLSAGSAVSTSANGTFSGNYGSGSNLTLKSASGAIVAVIDEKSGIIRPAKSENQVVVEWATSSKPLSLLLKDTNGKVLYTEQLSLSKDAAISEISDRKGIANSGLYFLAASQNISFVKNAANTATLPGGAFIVDSTSKKSIAGIGSDGNLYLMDTSYTLGYTEDSGYLTITIKNSSGTEIGRAIYAISAEFILR